MKNSKHKSNEIVKRKRDHLKVALSDASQIGNPGLDRFKFTHNALPEINFNKIDTTTSFLGKKADYPFFISCMTGGVKEGERINKNLALAAQKYRIPMGVGSQRIAIENPRFRNLFSIRKFAPDIVLMANVGLVQLNYGFELTKLQNIIDMIEADALVFHTNPIQEVIQPEGDRNFEGLLPKLEKIVSKLKVPVIVKEVGFGLSEDVIRRLYNIGVRIFDTAGWGGTNWAYIEGKRRDGYESLGELFSSWGIPTTESILAARRVKDENNDKSVLILGSGGVRSGIDIAKCIALGVDLVGIAMPFAKAAIKSQYLVEELIEKLSYELKIAMFGVGAKDLTNLKKTSLIEL